MSTEALTKAQERMLSAAPDDWAKEPLFRDSRPLGPLLRKGAIERRSVDVTPPEWGLHGARLVRNEWRITPAGRAVLATKENTRE